MSASPGGSGQPIVDWTSSAASVLCLGYDRRYRKLLEVDVKKSCPYLLISLLAVLLVYPYLLDRPWTEVLLVLLNSTVVLTAIYAVRETKQHLVTALAIGIPQLALSWINVVAPGQDFAIPQAIVSILFYGYALVRVLEYVLRGREVTIDKMYGPPASIC